MNCPFCAHPKDKVVDSREANSGEAIRRRRECLECGKRFTSYERIEEIPYLVIKKDGRREAFDRGKLTAGLHTACEKRPVSAKAIEAVVDEIESMLHDSSEREVEAQAIGERVMQRCESWTRSLTCVSRRCTAGSRTYSNSCRNCVICWRPGSSPDG